MKRVLIAGLVGGVIVFMWGAISHMLLPLGEMGLRSLPDEGSVVSTLQGSIREPGIYMFPGMAEGEMSEQQQQDWAARYLAGPTGWLVYHPQGEQAMSPGHLGMELLSDILAALVAAVLLSQTVGTYGRRVLFCVLLGLFAWLVISVPHWNWYRFPADYTLAEAIEELCGWLFVGLALAAIVRPAR